MRRCRERVATIVADAVAAQQCDASLPQPRRCFVVQTRQGRSAVPRAECLAPGLAAGADEQHIARSHLDAAGALRGFQIGDGDGLLWLKPVPAIQPRHVEQDAARDDAVLPDCDGVGACARRGDEADRPAVVGLALPEEVTQRVQMRVRDAMG